MIRGTKPTPTVLKFIRGNPRKENLAAKVATEPQPPTSLNVPKLPRDLYGDDEAKKEWNRVAPLLHSLGLLTDLDLGALMKYCKVHSQWMRIQKELVDGEDGFVIITSTGRITPNPLIAISVQLSKEMRQYMVDFGMNPSSRSRISVGAPPTKDPFEDYMNKKKER